MKVRKLRKLRKLTIGKYFSYNREFLYEKK